MRFLLGFNRDVIRRRRDEMHAMGVRVRWSGQRPRLWRSVIKELEIAEELTRDNDVVTLTMCVNYGGRQEIVGAAKELARRAARGEIDPERIDEKALARHLDEPDMPDVDLFLRSSGEQRTSNFLLWQSAYAEMVFLDTLFPDFDRRHLWEACEIYASRDRRYGGALDRTDTNGTAVSREAATTAGLLITARESLEQFVEVHVDDDGALSFRSRRRAVRGAGGRARRGPRRPEPDLRRGLGPRRTPTPRAGSPNAPARGCSGPSAPSRPTAGGT